MTIPPPPSPFILTRTHSLKHSRGVSKEEVGSLPLGEGAVFWFRMYKGTASAREVDGVAKNDKKREMVSGNK